MSKKSRCGGTWEMLTFKGDDLPESIPELIKWLQKWLLVVPTHERDKATISLYVDPDSQKIEGVISRSLIETEEQRSARLAAEEQRVKDQEFKERLRLEELLQKYPSHRPRPPKYTFPVRWREVPSPKAKR